MYGTSSSSTNMRPSAFLRTFSLRIPARLSSSPVVPWPVRTAFDRWLGTELDGLHCSSQQARCYTSATWLIHALDVAVATQKMTIKSIDDCGGHVQGCDRKAIDGYLEDVVELLDACNSLRDQMETVRKYIESLVAVAHCLRVGHDPSKAAIARARATLATCEAMERRCAEFDKCGSSLRKLGEKLAQGGALCMGRSCNKTGSWVTEFDEVLNGSKALGLLVCGMLSIALSFKSKRGLPMSQCRQAGSWSGSLHELHKQVKEEIDKRRRNGGVVLDELRQVTVAAQKLRGLISRWSGDEVDRRDLRAIVGELERSCGELEDGIKVFEGRINELYRQMISIRMVLLGLVTAA